MVFQLLLQLQCCSWTSLSTTIRLSMCHRHLHYHPVFHLCWLPHQPLQPSTLSLTNPSRQSTPTGSNIRLASRVHILIYQSKLPEFFHVPGVMYWSLLFGKVLFQIIWHNFIRTDKYWIFLVTFYLVRTNKYFKFLSYGWHVKNCLTHLFAPNVWKKKMGVQGVKRIGPPFPLRVV